jgi:hypothetical protein
MYSYVNYYVKGPLEFYNDEEDMLPTLKPPLSLAKGRLKHQINTKSV